MSLLTIGISSAEMKTTETTLPKSPEPSHSRLPASKRREQLIEVAADLFSQKGFNGTTTREIATAAGVTEAIIFRHFETKEQLYTAIIDRYLDVPGKVEWLADVQLAMDRNDDEAVVRQLIAGIIEKHKSDPQFERLMLYAALEGNQIALLYVRQVTADIVTAFQTYLNRRQKQGALRGISADAALIAVVGMAQHYARGRYIHGCQEGWMSDAEAVQSFTEIALNGIFGSQLRRKQ
jgi:TetR/AcrR family transcriptional regulator